VKKGIARGFSLVELLVVIGIIGLLIALLMPSLARARMQAEQVQCLSNIRQVGVALEIYANENDGWLYPPRLGANRARNERWTVHVFRGVWNPPIMICPSDTEPVEEHSYILNDHLFQRDIKRGKKVADTNSSDVIVMGEKRSHRNDYYMNSNEENGSSDYPTRVEPYRHGIRLGSNYLFMDGHAQVQTPKEAAAGIDPWALPTPAPEPAP